jgi:hypothetical protein
MWTASASSIRFECEISSLSSNRQGKCNIQRSQKCSERERSSPPVNPDERESAARLVICSEWERFSIPSKSDKTDRALSDAIFLERETFSPSSICEDKCNTGSFKTYSECERSPLSANLADRGIAAPLPMSIDSDRPSLPAISEETVNAPRFVISFEKETASPFTIPSECETYNALSNSEEKCNLELSEACSELEISSPPTKSNETESAARLGIFSEYEKHLQFQQSVTKDVIHLQMQHFLNVKFLYFHPIVKRYGLCLLLNDSSNVKLSHPSAINFAHHSNNLQNELTSLFRDRFQSVLTRLMALVR